MQRVLVFLFLSGFCVFGQTSGAGSLQRYFEEGERALAENRYAEAEKAFVKLRELDPGTAEIHAKLGVIYFQQGKFAQAVPTLRQALKLKPALPNADILLAMSLSELGHYGEALPGLEKGFRRSTDPALKRMAGLQLQRVYTGLQRESKAVEVALELSRLYPEDPEILYHAGRLFGNFAYLAIRKLAEVAPESVWRHQAAGEAHESQGEYDLAIMEYRNVLARDPGRPSMHYRLGRVLLAQSRQRDSTAEKLAGALAEFEQELQRDPTNADAAYEAAEINRKSAEFGKAREYFEIALKGDPNFQEAQVGMSRALIALDKPDLALPYLRKAISLNPEDEVPYYQLSQVYRKLRNETEQHKALAEFQRLRGQKSRQQKAIGKVFPEREVTKQELDSEAKP
jgi:tetratricopeptide (TPR) repeat protein